MKRIAILGATGSIGTQALNIISKNHEKFSVVLLSINSNIEGLIKILQKIPVPFIAVNDKEKAKKLKDIAINFPFIKKIYEGKEGLLEALLEIEFDVCLNAIVGWEGVIPSYHIINKRVPLLLSNKETLVVAGKEITELARKLNVPLIPVDSELSSLFQIIDRGELIKKVWITCSGGPFWQYSREQLKNVSIEETLRHPVWSMGTKITLDSATLMNKAFEIIAAHYLFNMPVEKLDSVIHPQAHIHAIIQYIDGNMKCIMYPPDMHIPINFALFYPERNSFEMPVSFFPERLCFYEIPSSTFPSINYAKEAIKGGSYRCALLNFANDFAQNLFLSRKINFLQIFEVIETVMDNAPSVQFNNSNIEDMCIEARRTAKSIIQSRMGLEV